MRVRSAPTSSKRTCPEVLTSPSVLFHAMPRVGLISVVLALYSTVLPSGPFTRQRLVSWPVAWTSSTFRIILGKFWKLDQYKKTSCSGACTSMLSCTRWGIPSLSLAYAPCLLGATYPPVGYV